MIVQFPTNKARKKPALLETKLNSLIKMLEVRYDHIHTLTEQMEKVELECQGLEFKYDKILAQLGERIGADQIPLKYLDYTNNIEFEHDELGNIFIKPILPKTIREQIESEGLGDDIA